LGDDWHDFRRSLILRVPSVASPSEFNMLVNQDHPEFDRLVVSSVEPIQWDQRTFGG
jgi:RES domain-containing protein